MRWKGQLAAFAAAVAVLAWAGVPAAQPLTADRAVEMALERNVQIIGADAGVDDARGGQYAALAGVLPNVSISVSRTGSWTDQQRGSSVFGTFVTPGAIQDIESYSNSPTLNASWSILDLSSLSGVSSARGGVRAALQTRQATRNDVAFETRRRFYEVVKAIKSAGVNAEASNLARDEERRVRALFEVGSVSKSDLLQAQVRTAQSQLDSLVSHNLVTVQRISLADQLGVLERDMGVVDTTLAPVPAAYDEAALVAEAAGNRPDLRAADMEVAASRANLRAANFRRLPSVSLSGSATLRFKNESTVTTFAAADSSGALTRFDPPPSSLARSENDLQYRATVALNWSVFDGLATDASIASARARLMRAESTRDQLRRNLGSEVRQNLLTYREAVEGLEVAARARESAEESLKLIQQKYRVGSATILELINAQVQLQRAANDQVTARAAIKVAEAAIERSRGASQ